MPRRKKTKAQRKAQYERIKARLNDQTSTAIDSAYESYDAPNYRDRLYDRMVIRNTKKKRAEFGENYTRRQWKQDMKNISQQADNEIARLNAMADRAYNNMSKAAGGKG